MRAPLVLDAPQSAQETKTLQSGIAPCNPMINLMSNDHNCANVDNLVESIVALNPRADREWLVSFDAYDLTRYLQHLECALEPRTTATPWERRGDTPAIVSRTAA